MFELTDKVALVTGGAGYLGSSVCKALFHQGAHVVIADYDEQKAERVAEDLGNQSGEKSAVPLCVDVADTESVTQCITRVIDTFQQLDILVSATFVPHGDPLETITPEGFSETLAGNVGGCFHLLREAKRNMREGGSIVCFSSMYGSVAPDPRIYEQTPNPIEYGVSKAGIEQMIRYLAVRWAPEGIRVNGVAPGPFPHPELQEQDPAFIERLAHKVPMGRIGKQNETAGAVAFLASEAATYITGHTLPIDGGWTVW